MNKAGLVDALTVRLGDKKAATQALEAVLEEIQRAVSKGDNVAIAGFGVFEKRPRAARTARNPRTGEAVKVKKTSVPAFRAGQGFKDFVAGKKKLAKVAKKAAAKKAAAKKTTAKAARAVAKKAPARKATTKATTARAATKKAATKATRKTATKKTATKRTARKR